MSLITLVVVLIVVGVLLWLVQCLHTHGPKDQVHPECRCRHCCRDLVTAGFRRTGIVGQHTYRPRRISKRVAVAAAALPVARVRRVSTGHPSNSC